MLPWCSFFYGRDYRLIFFTSKNVINQRLLHLRANRGGKIFILPLLFARNCSCIRILTSVFWVHDRFMGNFTTTHQPQPKNWPDQQESVLPYSVMKGGTIGRYQMFLAILVLPVFAIRKWIWVFRRYAYTGNKTSNYFQRLIFNKCRIKAMYYILITKYW